MTIDQRPGDGDDMGATSQRYPGLTPDHVLTIAAYHCCLGVKELQAKRRDHGRLDTARLLTYGLLDEAGFGPRESGRTMGREHATIVICLRRLPELRRANALVWEAMVADLAAWSTYHAPVRHAARVVRGRSA